MADAPTFIVNDPPAILSEVVELYQQITGRVLQPAQIERLLLGAYAYRESILREQVQAAATQNLVAFAAAPALDYLGELVGVYRLAASPALCTLEFTLVDGHTGVVIPANTRVASGDGKVYFSTVENVTVPSGETTATVEAIAFPEGTIGNGYTAGEIKTILDPQAFITAAENTTATNGGADAETDEQLRARILLAPGSFSTAGSRQAYVFHAKTASQTIIDVAVVQLNPGEVGIYPFTGTLPTSAEILNLVAAACSDEKVRPLTDTVTVLTPTAVNYDVDIQLVTFEAADQVATLAAAQQAVDAYIAEKGSLLGQDITMSQLIAVAQVDGVYSVTLADPTADVVVAATEVSVVGTVSVTIIDTTNG